MKDKKDTDAVNIEDRALFRSCVGPVKRMKTDIVQSDRRKPSPMPIRRSSLEEVEAWQYVVDSSPLSMALAEVADRLNYLRPGVQKRLMNKLRRGKFAIQAELDLHGSIVRQAKLAVMDFIRDCQNKRIRAIKIIHGKGHGSKSRYPILKNNLNQWLQLNDTVLAFCSAPPADGGVGAVYVLLKG